MSSHSRLQFQDGVIDTSKPPEAQGFVETFSCEVQVLSETQIVTPSDSNCLQERAANLYHFRLTCNQQSMIIDFEKTESSKK